MARNTTLILGGYGSFGSLIAEQLSHLPQVVVAGRNARAGRQFARSIGVEFEYCDLGERGSLERLLTRVGLVVNAAGPFRAGDYRIPRLCVEAGCHYIDMADGRQYVAGIAELDQAARRNQVFVCAGASTVPAVTAAMLDELSTPGFGPIDTVRIALSAGNKNQAGVSTFASILSYAGAPLPIWQADCWRARPGWGLAEFVSFPPPVGRRRVQLCDVPDLELFPVRYRAQSVIFKAGVELLWFNYALSFLAELHRRAAFISLPVLAGPLVRISRLFKHFGSYSGGVLVSLRNRGGRERTLALVTAQNGARIPTAPAVLLARKVLAAPPRFGAFPCTGFLNFDELETYLAPFGISTVRA